MLLYVMTRDPQFSLGHGISSRAAEFVLCCGISAFLRNLAEFA